MKTLVLSILRSLGRVTRKVEKNCTTYSVNNRRFSVQIFTFKAPRSFDL